MSLFYAYPSVENYLYCFYVSRNTLVIIYKYNENIQNANPDGGVHWSCQAINKEGMYTGAKNAIMWVDFTPIARYKTISIAIMYQGILWAWSTSTIETYKTLTQTLVCTDHVKTINEGK